MDRTRFDSSRLKQAANTYSSSDSESSEDEFRIPGVGESDEFMDHRARKRRRLGGDSKEKAALGIFASDSEDDGPRRKWKGKSLRNQGMAFVSTGAKNIGDEDEDEDEDDNPVEQNEKLDEADDTIPNSMDVDDEEDYEDEDDGLRTGGLGLGASYESGNGTNGSFQPSRKPPKTTFTKSFRKPAFDSSNPFGQGFVPSSAREPVLRDDLPDDTPPAPKARPSAFSNNGKGKVNPNSFGAKMMAKMGYVHGQGLGREGQGRNIIIEANLRPQGIGLGAVKEKTEQERKEEKRQAKLRGEVLEDSEEEEEKRRQERKKKQKERLGGVDSNASTPRRQKPKYLTAEELRKSAPGLHIPDAFTPILDLTGPGSRVLSSASGLLTPTSASAAESAEVAEARKLARRARLDLASFTEEWHSLFEKKTWIDRELEERERELADLTTDFQKLQAFARIAEELPQAPDWATVVQSLRRAVEVGPANETVANVIVGAIEPYLRESDWDPLQEPTRFASDLAGLETILLGSDDHAQGQSLEKADSSVFGGHGIYRQHQRSTTQYESLMYKVWLPKVLRAIREWDVYDPDPAMKLLDSWNDLLPAFVRAELMQNIIRRLESAVAEWNPRIKQRSGQQQHRNARHPHLWLFPWLPHVPAYHLDPRGTGVVGDVRRKFRTLIDSWEFERGVIPGLRQWQAALGDQWNPLLVGHLIPSMSRYLERHFRIDPTDQAPYLPILQGVLQWCKIVSPAAVAEVVVAKVFPGWHERLEEWLGLEEADFGEVAEWFSWWDGLYPEEIKGESVKREFEKGLLTMEKAVEGY